MRMRGYVHACVHLSNACVCMHGMCVDHRAPVEVTYASVIVCMCACGRARVRACVHVCMYVSICAM